MRLKKFLALLLGVCMTFCFGACGKGDAPGEGSTSMIDMSNNYIKLNNGLVSVAIDRTTGYIATVKNQRTDFVNKNPEEGSWPFYIEYAKPGTSVIKNVSIDKAANSRVGGLKTFAKDGREYLEVRYDTLKTDGQSPEDTGIAATVTYSIGAADEFFKYTVAIDMTNASGSLNALHLASGGDLRSGDRADEYLTAPVWGTGTKWKNPAQNQKLMTQRTLAYPGENNSTLESGWLDLSGSNQGIGIAYINKQQLSCEFRIESSGQGMGLEVVLFQPKQILGKSVPLVKGDKFTSDDMVIAPHGGDWHTFADIYRAEFEKAFTNKDGTPDYLTADTLSKKADAFRYFVRETCNYSGTGTNPDGSITSFRDMNRNFTEDFDQLGVDPKNTFLWLVGLSRGTYGKDVPFTLPFNERDLVSSEDAGKTALQCFEQYINDGYIKKGGSYMQYSHPFAVDPLQPEIAKILSRVDPNQHAEEWNGTTHKSVCIDNDIMMDLWKNKLIPEYKSLHADGVQFDQNSLTQTVCDMTGHNHGTDAVSRLSSHNKAINELCVMMRKELGDGAYILSEATNDITCRYVDIRQNHWLEHTPKWDGEYEFGTTMYTFPQYVYNNANYIVDSLGNRKEFFLQGAVLGGIMLVTDGPQDALKKEYVRFADSLADNHVPGYPHGFQDTVGLSVGSSALFARVYKDGNKVSVLYSASAKVTDAPITVNLDKLGFAGKGTREIKVTLKANQAGYQIIEVV